MKYDDRMPVVTFRIEKKTKDLLQEVAGDFDIKLNSLCRKIMESYLRQRDMFELVFKKPTSED